MARPPPQPPPSQSPPLRPPQPPPRPPLSLFGSRQLLLSGHRPRADPGPCGGTAEAAAGQGAANAAANDDDDDDDAENDDDDDDTAAAADPAADPAAAVLAGGAAPPLQAPGPMRSSSRRTARRARQRAFLSRSHCGSQASASKPLRTLGRRWHRRGVADAADAADAAATVPCSAPSSASSGKESGAGGVHAGQGSGGGAGRESCSRLEEAVGAGGSALRRRRSRSARQAPLRAVSQPALAAHSEKVGGAGNPRCRSQALRAALGTGPPLAGGAGLGSGLSGTGAAPGFASEKSPLLQAPCDEATGGPARWHFPQIQLSSPGGDLDKPRAIEAHLVFTPVANEQCRGGLVNAALKAGVNRTLLVHDGYTANGDEFLTGLKRLALSVTLRSCGRRPAPLLWFSCRLSMD